ncbi:MAG: Gldg family protein [Planctomycetes bacterium]|nr:Gldg family protein [Planctomycetota bacterium]
MNRQAMAAIFKRDLRAYFGNPTGYVFILLFVVLTGVMARPHTFFTENKANLDLLTAGLPWLLVAFIPAVTMASWATEYRQGTDQLLLTLPAQDPEVVLAKYGACFGIYTIALAFTGVANIVVLEFLGSPDLGLMFATYLGYWLLGGALVAVGMLGSSLTSNQTLGFIVGAIFCAALVAMQWLSPVVAVRWAVPAEVVHELSAVTRFESFGRGVVALEDVLYFVGVAGAALFANTVVIGRRHWTQGSERRTHGVVRLAAVAVAAASGVLFVQQAAARVDITSEGMLSLKPEAKKILASLSEDRPVTVEAWISPQVPGPYVATRDALLRMLRELDARGGDKVHVIVHETKLFSEEAERAETLFKIKPERVEKTDGGRRTSEEVFMGLVFRCGTRELTIPFFHRGLPIQYELTRAIGAVADLERKKVGIVTAGLNIFGGFDFNTMQRSAEWQVIRDLRNQYEVSEVAGTAPIDTSLDVLVVPLATALPQGAIDRIAEYMHQGGNALFFVDPFPISDMEKAPMRPPGAGRNPFQQPRGPDPERGELDPLLHALGASFPKERVVWDGLNPHPEFEFPKEVAFVVPPPADAERPKDDPFEGGGFNQQDPITAGLQELALIYPGEVEAVPLPEVQATPLLRTGPRSGWHRWSEHFQESFFGLQPVPADTRPYQPKDAPRTLALRLKGQMRAPKDTEAMKRGDLGKPFEAIVIADMDLISDSFYSLRRQGDKSLPELDNVTFVANCIDALAGEDAYLALRKLRPRHRPLAYFERLEAELTKQQTSAVEAAKTASKEQLEQAQKRLDQKLEEVQRRTDLDRRNKEIMLRAAREREQRKFDAEKRRIEDEERDAARRARTQAERARSAAIFGVMAVSLGGPVPPVLLLGLIVFIRKTKRERELIPTARRRVA